MLINDNTNKDLLKEYLKLLKKSKDKLKVIFKDNFVDFKEEFNIFCKAFTKEENIYHFEEEVKSQKKEFNEFIKTIYNLKDYSEIDFEIFLKQFDKYFENISYFNMPIDFSNEELFYYRSINIIKYSFKNIYDKINKNLEKFIKKINYIGNNISENEKKEKIKNYKKDLLLFELDKIKSNINLCINDLNELNDLKMINDLIIPLIFSKDKNLFKYCYNYIKLDNKDIKTILPEENEEWHITEMLKSFEKVNFDLNLIKEFYKHILPLQCFKSIFLTLNGKDSYYPFENKEFTDDFVENHFEVLDIPIFTSLGLTDKFTMKTYFIPFMPKVYYGNSFHFKNENIIIKNGFFVRIGNHEIGHNFTNINFYMENCQISIQTPRKKQLNKIEGGAYIDFALFGKVLKELNLEQVLYILNEKNYEKTYIDFQYDFNNIKEEDLKVQGVFKQMCENIYKSYKKDFEKNTESIFIRLNPTNITESKIYCDIKNDVIFGNTISDKE